MGSSQIESSQVKSRCLLIVDCRCRYGYALLALPCIHTCITGITGMASDRGGKERNATAYHTIPVEIYRVHAQTCTHIEGGFYSGIVGAFFFIPEHGSKQIADLSEGKDFRRYT